MSLLTEVSEEIAPIVEELSVTPMETLEETVIASTVAMEGYLQWQMILV